MDNTMLPFLILLYLKHIQTITFFLPTMACRIFGNIGRDCYLRNLFSFGRIICHQNHYFFHMQESGTQQHEIGKHQKVAI